MIPEQDKANIRKRVQQIQGALELISDTTRDLARKQEELWNSVPFEDWDTPQCRSKEADIHYAIQSAMNGLSNARSELRQAANLLRPLSQFTNTNQ